MTASKKTINSLDRLKISAADSKESMQWMTYILQSSLFSSLPTKNLQEVFKLFEQRNVKAGDTIIKQGDHGEYYYQILSGRCSVRVKATDMDDTCILAELNEGDHFGEEALIGNTLRNATVKMITDGVLLRLKKDDFLHLIKDPTIEMISMRQAQKMITQGAVWLDVRSPEECQNHDMDGCINMPLNIIRKWSGKLDHSKYYITYCDIGTRSSIAAFLLAELGFTVSCLEGGLIAQGVIETTDDTEKSDTDAVSEALSTVLTNVYTLLEQALKEKVDPTVAKQIVVDISQELSTHKVNH